MRGASYLGHHAALALNQQGVQGGVLAWALNQQGVQGGAPAAPRTDTACPLARASSFSETRVKPIARKRLEASPQKEF